MEDLSLQILKSLKNQIIKQSLQPQFQWIKYKNPKYNDIKVNFQEDNRFFENKVHKWIWYKNLNIPLYSFTLNSLYDEIFYMQVLAFKWCSDQINENVFIHSQLSGVTVLKIQNQQQQSLNGVRFIDTSFKYRVFINYVLILIILCQIIQGEKFILMFIIKNSNNEIIQARISSFIFVESRKKSHKERQTVQSIFNPFLPEQLKKKIIIHPFFLLLKFPKAIKLYYNTNYVKANENHSHLFVSLQKEILKILLFPNKNEKEQYKNKIFIMCLNINCNSLIYYQDYQIKEIIKHLKPLQGQILSFSECLLDTIPAQFQEFEYHVQKLYQPDLFLYQKAKSKQYLYASLFQFSQLKNIHGYLKRKKQSKSRRI
ncbi:hypothetical protein IMG5_098690 [Ichthyophthirius multifiliis]|uniref:Uncharacterized protein n=1 Tax=Ichthyophthirius multifiliis TaxID=5932 RepID=G0QS03_ICHMU|nr:hypothetical protein IMG5_098690 [Ichthyophthirius multifiliis]EGR32033.1 hypothetical protein IMG5_098690 [Ichthyophthirius multifiliis]|eukprot:XP_004035519.1 hypothetical protein IMG5_098690 [Ichthyophthirius multifiliis]